MNGRRVIARVAFVLLFVVTVALLPPPYLFAKPAMPVGHPERATVTHFSGPAFDTPAVDHAQLALVAIPDDRHLPVPAGNHCA